MRGVYVTLKEKSMFGVAWQNSYIKYDYIRGYFQARNSTGKNTLASSGQMLRHPRSSIQAGSHRI
jgi:hypothetical protein